MRRNAVVVAHDAAISSGEVLQWLAADDVNAYGSADQTALDMVRELKPRVAVCSDKPDGIAFCYAVRALPEPPMVVVLSEDPLVRDDVYFDGLTVIAIVRAPVRMASLSRFICSSLRITERLDRCDPDAGLAPESLLFHIAHHSRTVH